MKKLLLFAVTFFNLISLSAQNYTYQISTGVDKAFDDAFNDAAPPSSIGSPNHNAFSTTLNLPFTWKFYGQTVSSYKISTNGFITFNTANSVNDTVNTTLPTAGGPNNAIYGFWDNLDFRASGGTNGQADDVIVFTYGTSPKRHHVIAWQSVSHRTQNVSGNMWFMIRINECGDFDIIKYNGVSVAPFTLGTVGCENADGTLGTMVSGSPNLTFDDQGGFDYEVVENIKFSYGGIAYDLSLDQLDLEVTTAAGQVPITGTVANNGTTAITSFDVSYTIDNGAPVTQTLTGLNIAQGANYGFTHPTFWNATEGTHTVNVTISNLNGAGNVDERSCNNSLKAGTHVYDFNNKVKKIPLFEILTSSTCPPCKPGNEIFHGIVDTKNQKDFVQVKYQQNFPGTGDPYATNEAVNRRAFYGVSAIPHMTIDGGWNQNANNFTASDYDNATSKQTFFKIEGTYSMDTFDKKMDIKLRYTPLADFTGATGVKLHMAIVETRTTRNVKSNQETEFFYVMKKMIGNENGQTLTQLAKNVAVDIDSSFTFKGTYRLPANGSTANRINHATENSVENWSNLRVVAWIQINNNNVAEPKYVVQAYNLTDLANGGVGINENVNIENSVSIYPNPAKEFASLYYNLKADSKMSIKLMDVTGKVVYQSNEMNKAAGEHENIVYTSQLANGVYNMILTINDKVIAKKLVVAND
jgi:hypothetical protein